MQGEGRENHKDTKDTKIFYLSLCPLCLCGFYLLFVLSLCVRLYDNQFYTPVGSATLRCAIVRTWIAPTIGKSLYSLSRYAASYQEIQYRLCAALCEFETGVLSASVICVSLNYHTVRCLSEQIDERL